MITEKEELIDKLNIGYSCSQLEDAIDLALELGRSYRVDLTPDASDPDPNSYYQYVDIEFTNGYRFYFVEFFDLIYDEEEEEEYYDDVGETHFKITDPDGKQREFLWGIDEESIIDYLLDQKGTWELAFWIYQGNDTQCMFEPFVEEQYNKNRKRFRDRLLEYFVDRDAFCGEERLYGYEPSDEIRNYILELGKICEEIQDDYQDAIKDKELTTQNEVNINVQINNHT